jgi:aryl-alcohol dehydrogenase-like predicted oxidoreductase
VLAAGAASGRPERAPNAGDPGGALAAGSRYTDDVERAGGLASLTGELGTESAIELAVRFGLSKAGVSTVLVGYSTLDHLEQAIRFAERGPLPQAAVERVLELSR